MSEPPPRTSDCVQSMRQIRDKLRAEIEEVSYDDLANGPGFVSTRARSFREGCPVSGCSGTAFGRPLIGEASGGSVQPQINSPDCSKEP